MEKDRGRAGNGARPSRMPSVVDWEVFACNLYEPEREIIRGSKIGDSV